MQQRLPECNSRSLITRPLRHRVKGWFHSTKTMNPSWWNENADSDGDFENAASLQNYFLTLPRRLMRRSTIKDTNTINVQTAATAHVGVCSKVYTIAVVSRFNCPIWFYLTWNPEISLSLFLQSSISASTPLLPRLKRSIIIMYANSGVQSMAWVVYASYSSLLPLLGLTPRIWTCTPDRTEFGVRSRSIAAEARTEGM